MLLVDGGVGKRTGPRVLEEERLAARKHLRAPDAPSFASGG